MDRINQILKHPVFQEDLKIIEQLEKDRIYCRHNMEHFLNTARIAWILNLEERHGLSKDLVYGAALLHDIGKFRQYQDKIPHEQASARIAPDLLKDCGYSQEECAEIIKAIRAHKDGPGTSGSALEDILYRADKLSRNCFSCKAREECNWDRKGKKRNLELSI